MDTFKSQVKVKVLNFLLMHNLHFRKGNWNQKYEALTIKIYGSVIISLKRLEEIGGRYSMFWASLSHTLHGQMSLPITGVHRLGSGPNSTLRDSFRPMTWLCSSAYLVASRQLLYYMVCVRLIQYVIKKCTEDIPTCPSIWLFGRILICSGWYCSGFTYGANSHDLFL